MSNAKKNLIQHVKKQMKQFDFKRFQEFANKRYDFDPIMTKEQFVQHNIECINELTNEDAKALNGVINMGVHLADEENYIDWVVAYLIFTGNGDPVLMHTR